MFRLAPAFALVLAATLAAAQENEKSPEEPAAAAEQSHVERGKYLVHHVAMCVVCHSPKTDEGAIIDAQLLRGAAMPVASPYPRQKWAFRAPALAGLGGFSEQEITAILQTGARPNGESPRPPMPPFRMNAEDAQAIVAYLKSVGS